MWIAIIGNLCEGYRFVGPFPSSDSARLFLRKLPPVLSEGNMVLDLIQPDQITDGVLKALRKHAQ